MVEAPSREEPVAEADVESAAEAGQPLPIDEPQAPAAAAGDERPEKGSSRRRRLLRSHSAIAGIAEALERAQDPTLADLPGAREAAEALAALQREVEARTDTVESEALVDEAAVMAEPQAAVMAEPQAAVPSELEPPNPAAEASFVEPAAATSAQQLVVEEPLVDVQPPVQAAELAAETATELELPEAEPQPAAALESEQAGDEPEASGAGKAEPDAAPMAAPAPSPYTTEVVEPDWFADGDFTWLEAAQADSASNEETEETASAEPEPQAAAIQSPALGSDERGQMDETTDPAPAAEAIQDAFEPTEPDASEPQPETAVVGQGSGPEPEPVIEAIQEPELEQASEIEPAEAERVPAAEAIQDAFEPAEPGPHEPEPDAAVAGVRPEPDRVNGAVQEPVTESAQQPEEPQFEPVVPERAPAAEAIQDAFEATLESAELPAPEAEPAAEADASEQDQSAEASAEFQLEAEASAAVEEPELEPETVLEAEIARDEAVQSDEDAGPVAEAIQDAFEPPEASPSVAGTPAAIATAREEPFAPADVAVFAVDESEPERARMPDTDAQARPPEASAESVSQELPPAPPRTEGIGGLAVRAAALPAVQPATPGTPRPQEEELMWLGDEFEAAEFEIAAPGWHSQPEHAAGASVQQAAETSVQTPVEPSVEASVEPSHVAGEEMTHDAQAHGMSDADLQQIAQDEGWDADEVDAIRTLLGRPTTAQAFDEPEEQADTHSSAAFSVDSALPPDDVHPMDEASAAPPDPEWHPSEEPFYEPFYEPPDVPLEAEPEPMPSVEWPTAEPVSPESPVAEATAPEPIAEPTAPEPQVADASVAQPPRALPIEESIRQSIASRPSERRPTAPDPDWLRRRRGPAARAYRRLRRLLPG
jgi:hypothetical protein